MLISLDVADIPTKKKNSVPKIRVTAKISDSGSWQTVDNKCRNKSLLGADPTSLTAFTSVRKQPRLVPSLNLKLNSIAPILSGNIRIRIRSLLYNRSCWRVLLRVRRVIRYRPPTNNLFIIISALAMRWSVLHNC